MQHELLAPVPREPRRAGPGHQAAALHGLLRAPSSARCPGCSSAASCPATSLAPVVYCAATGALVAALAVGTAMIASGRRLGWWIANGIAVLVIGWSVARHPRQGQDLAAHLARRPGLLEHRGHPDRPGLGGVWWSWSRWSGWLGIGNLSIEAARRRAGLVAQLRFAVTLQDMRTVVLLRRQLAQEKPRNRPWIRTRPGRPAAADLAPRLAELPALPDPPAAADAGARPWSPACRSAPCGAAPPPCSSSPGWRSTWPPTTRSSPSPRRSTTRPGGRASPTTAAACCILHLPAAIFTMVVVCGIAAASALILVPGKVVGQLAVPMILTVAVCATIAAAVSTSMGTPERGQHHGAWGLTCSASCWPPAWWPRRPSPSPA